ncbi:sigma-70 family RNA polymerase sigma factor [Neobacillus sp. YX16]|uniref:sigma-70 family RNA polymerase sigma factor n=1 Tax=Neobacillus sp. YX16 TaxID=3047874 RepID=UPI0024C37A41|nr:sigma-70 family RNA polymerase sigma factor [Neobacillus sp. YX16]WHZ02838.1 sigma-70 family RNA polymerase sigma factor [Neobacillus sp. YX16]
MESFDELVVQYQPMIQKIIRSLHIYKNKHEFYQTGLIALWEAARSFDERKGSFSNYAYTSIKGKMLSEMTQINHYKEKNILPKEEEFWEDVEGQESPLFLEKETIQTYCEGLTKKEAQWVIETFINQLSIKEIAKSEKVTVSAVKQWKLGAIKKLKGIAANHH